MSQPVGPNRPISPQASLPAQQTVKNSGDMAPMHTEPAILFNPSLSNVTPVKPSRKKIYQKIDDVICQVKTSKGTGTGFFIGKNLICVPFHVLSVQEIEKISGTQSRVRIDPIHCIYQGVSYEAEWYTPNLDAAYAFDCAIFRIKDNDFLSMPDLEIFTGEIEPGEKVYFGGFPLTQEDPTFHGGIISSVPNKGGTSFFTVDATVVPGNSGGPVFIWEGNKLKLIGVLCAQIADFSPEDQETIAIMKALKTQNQITPGRDTFMQVGAISLGSSGLTSNVTITTSLGTKVVSITDRDVMCLALELIERNLSTGIGKALHVKHILDVCDGRTAPFPAPKNSGMPVMKGERLPGMLPRNAVYLGWYHRQVKGQSLCMQIIGRQLGAADNISADEEKALWNYYQSNPSYNGFTGLSPEDEFNKLKDKIASAKPKALKNNKESWKRQLEELKESLPPHVPEIQKLISSFSVDLKL